MELGETGLRSADRLSLRRWARTLGGGIASLVVVAGTITAFGAAVVGVDSAPAAAALSCNDNWTGGDAGNPTSWNDTLNWSAGIPNSGSVDACIGGDATVVVPNAGFSVGELTVSTGSTLTVGASGGTTVASLSVGSGLENDGTLTAGPSGTGFAGLTLNGPITNTGALTADGTVTVGNSTGTLITNEGTWTLGTAGTMTLGGSSSFTQSGSGAQLNDLDVTGDTATANNNSIDDNGSFIVDGGTICGTGPNLHGGAVGGDTVVFGSSTPAGPACGSGLAVDQIDLSGGTNTLSGTIPAGYTLTTLVGGVLEPNVNVTNNGAIVLDYGAFYATTASTTFTNAGTFDVPANTNGSTFNALDFVNSPTGAFSVEGQLSVGNSNGTLITNEGTWTLGTAGTMTLGGSSSFTQDGVLTDSNVSGDTATANNNSFDDNGSFIVDGGTICGTGPNLHGGAVGGDTLVFGAGPTPGPNCAGGVAEDQIDLSGGTNTLSGNIPAGYTLTTLVGGVLEPNVTLTNNGAIVLDYGAFYATATGITFTNAGTFDVPANSNGSTFNALAFDNAATGTLSVEGQLSVGNSNATAITNDGTVGVAPGGVISVGGSSSVTNKSDGLLAFGIDGLPSSTSNYGRIINGTLTLNGTADPVFDNGYTPPTGTEYFVSTGSSGYYSGTFSTVLHNATADYSHPTEVGLTGGAPATPTSTAVTSSVPTSSVFGQGVQLTATVSPNTPTNPSGSVSFYADGISIGSAPVSTSAGVTTASLDVSDLRVGSEAITATYNGDVVFDASTSPVLTQVVDLDPSNVTITPSPANPVPGQQVTYTVQVSGTAPGAGTPTGAVSLTDGGTPIPGCQNLVMGPLGPSFVTCSVTYETVAPHTIGASYAGDTDFTSGTGSVPLTVQPATTSTVVTSSDNPGPIDANITYTATISVVAPGSGTPTGTVSFTDQGSPVTGCQNLPLPATGQVTCTETYSVNAAHSIVATYSGDTNDAGSHGSLTETLQQISTSTTIGSSASTSTYGQGVTFTATVTPTQTASVNPSGTVTFYNNDTIPASSIGTVGVSTTGGVTTSVLQSNLAAGSYSVTATYNGDQTFSTSSSSPTSPADLTVDQATTTLGLVSSANPAVVGQTVTFTATLSSSASGETGTVQFDDNGVSIGSGSVSGGQAQFQTSSLALGGHPITAVYEGDDNFVGSSSTNTVSQTIVQASTTTAVTSSANPGTVGQTINYTATVSVNGPGSGTPTGTVSFSDSGSPISACQDVGFTAPLQATCPQVYSTNAGHSITATYNGDTNFTGSTSAPYGESLSQVSTTTSVGALPTTSTYGQSVTITATVAPTSGTANPTGSVTFTDNGTTALGSSALSTTAGVTTASILVTSLPVGGDSITASYGGSSGFLGSATTTAATVTVSQAATSLDLGTSVNPSTYGQSVTLTATVLPTTGSGETGTVTFLDNGSPFGNGSVSNGQATLTTTALPVGTDLLTASYNGDTNFVGSSTNGSLSQVVNKATTSLGLGSSVNPSTSGQSVTFTATVIPGTGSGETGTVTFYDNGTSIGTGGVSGGTATLATTTLPVGTDPITATYGGDGNFAGSATTGPLNQVVNKVTTSLSLGSSVNPSTSGQSVTFTATVTPTSGSGETGTVTFYDNGTFIGAGGVSGGTASLATTTLPLGTDPITATYGGDGTFQGSSTVSALSQVVNSSVLGTTISLTSSTNPSTVSQSPVFQATVSATGGSGGPPAYTGTVTLYEGSTAVQTQSVSSGGVVFFTLSQLSSAYAIGSHTFTATYSGGGQLTGSTSPPLVQQVAPPIYSDDDLGQYLVIANSVTDQIANRFYGGPNSCGCNVAEYLAVNPSGTTAYLMQPGLSSAKIEAINTATGATEATISMPTASVDLVMSPNGADLYVAEGFDGEAVAVISTATNTITNTISVALGANGEPVAMAINAAGTELAVAQDTVTSLVNLTTDRVTNVILFGSEGVAFSPNGATVYVTNGYKGVATFGANTVTAISTATGTITRTYSGMTEPITLAVNPAGTELFVSNVGTYGSGSTYTTKPYVAALNVSTGAVTDISQPTWPDGVTVSPDGTKVYLGEATGDIAILNASTNASLGSITGYEGPDTIRVMGATAPAPPVVPPPSVSTTTLPTATQTVYYGTTLAATSGVAPYSWSLASGSLPSGLTLSSGGAITGTPTSTATTSTFTVKVTDSDYPPASATATLTLTVAPASTAPPPCGGASSSIFASGPGLPAPSNCVSATNATSGGTATATSTATAGTVTVTAHGTGGFTVGQYTQAPSGGVGFRAASNSFDLALSSSNTFTSITVVDCALAGATSLNWWDQAADGGLGAWLAVSPQTYNHLTRCDTITFSATSSPTLAELTGTAFAGVLPAQTVTITKGGSTPYSISGSVLSGSITTTQGPVVTQVSGTVALDDSSGLLTSVTVNASCILGVCIGTYSVNDPEGGSFTTPSTTITVGTVNATQAGGKGTAFPDLKLSDAYPISWNVTTASS